METKERVQVFKQDTRPDLSQMSRKDILTRRPCGSITGVKGTPKDFVSYQINYTACCIGSRIFWKKTSKTILIFSKNKFKGDMTPELISQALKAFNIDWIPGGNREYKELAWVRRLIRLDKYLWSLVFSGKVTNPEDLVKRFSRKYFNEMLSYRAAKLYFSHPTGFLQQMYNYSTNLNLCIEKTIVPETYSYDSPKVTTSNLILDMLRYAEIENKKINPAWNMDMLQFVHKAQIARDIKNTADSYPDKLIANSFKKDGLELILSEKECFIEGKNMNNCVHRCYWDQVYRGNYLLARGTINGEYINFGIRVRALPNDDSSVLTVDQIHTFDNGCPSQATMDYCTNWMLENRESLKAIASICKANKESQPKLSKEEEIFDIPF